MTPHETKREITGLIENLEEWADHFRNKQHGATLSILRAKKTITDQAARIEQLEDALNQIFHYTDCTSGQMAIIDEISSENETSAAAGSERNAHD